MDLLIKHIIITSQVLHMQNMEHSQAQIMKTLDRLRFFAAKSSPQESISPFYHAAQTLLKYADQEKDTKKKQKYFQEFYCEFEKFAMSDFSKLKKHHEEILDEIAEIIESPTFLECIRPDLHNIRHLRNSLKIEKIESLNADLENSKSSWYSGKSTSSPIKKSRFDYSDQVKSQQSQEQQSSSKQQSPVLDSLSILYKSILKSYQQHNLDQAFSKTQQYLTLCANPTSIPLQKSQFLKTVSDEHELMSTFYEQFDKGEWIFDKEQKDIKLQYKIDETQNMIAIRIIGQGNIPLQQFLAIISEIDLMGDYVPFCYDCKEIKKISRNQRIGHSKIYIPLMKDRETFFYAAGYDRIKTHKSLFFFSKTINQDLHYLKKYNINLPPADKYIRLEYKFFLIEYIPLEGKRARIRLASKIDMKMDFIPKFILFRSARVFAFDYFKNIIDRIKNFKGSPWEKKLKENPEMYKFFRKKLDQHLIK